MLQIRTIGKGKYDCTLTSEEEKAVVNYIKKDPVRFNRFSAEDSILIAVEELWEDGKIDLYGNSEENDFTTESLIWCPYEERSAEEILNIKKENKTPSLTEEMEVITHKDLHPNSRNSTPICPICEKRLAYYGIKFDHCPHCGQKLKWK